MKATILTAAMIAASVAIMSCDKNETKVTNDDGKVRFTSGITATPGSRAAIDAEGNSVWEKGDPVGIYMVEHGAADVVGENGNVKYAAGGAGASTAFTAAGAAIYFPMDEARKVDFIAYHPYNAAVTGFTYPVDLSEQTPQTAIDLMTAKADKSGVGYTKADGRSNTTVDFAFSHRLAKLVVDVTKDASVPGNITAVSITGMNTAATYDLTGAGGVTSPKNPADITPCTITAQEKYEAILLTVGALTAAHTMTFTTDGGETYVWKMSQQIPALEEGKIYTYTVNVTKYAVTAHGSIKKWVVGSTGTGTAE